VPVFSGNLCCHESFSGNLCRHEPLFPGASAVMSQFFRKSLPS
jgi:hypothetical protein